MFVTHLSESSKGSNVEVDQVITLIRRHWTKSGWNFAVTQEKISLLRLSIEKISFFFLNFKTFSQVTPTCYMYHFTCVFTLHLSLIFIWDMKQTYGLFRHSLKGKTGFHYIIWKFSHYNFSCTCALTLNWH